MTLEEFEIQVKKNKRFLNYWHYAGCFFIMGISVFMLHHFLTIPVPPNFNIWKKIAMCAFFVFLFLFSLYGLYFLRNAYKLSFWNNGLKKEENIRILKLMCPEFFEKQTIADDTYAHFFYRRKAWAMPYEVHLFADTNFIAMHLDGISPNGGFIELGGSKKRAQSRIVEMMKEKASI